MKSFLAELRIIPRVVWPIAVLIAGGVFSLLLFVAMPRDPNWQKWSTAAQVTFATWIAVFTLAWILLIGYVNADARRRGMRYIMWTLLATFIINGIGFILYFVLRDPLLVACQKCGALGRSGFVFCPQCGAELARSCPVCKRAVEPSWNRCAFCGMQLTRETVGIRE